MKSFTVHPAADEAPESAAFVPDGFSLPALIFGPFWLAWHRQWLGLAGYVGAWVGLWLLGRWLGLPAFAASLLSTLLNLAVALEGGQLRRWRLERSGRPAAAIVTAGDLDEAEIRYFAALAAAAPPRPQPLPSEGPLWAPRPVGIIGLFPERAGR